MDKSVYRIMSIYLYKPTLFKLALDCRKVDASFRAHFFRILSKNDFDRKFFKTSCLRIQFCAYISSPIAAKIIMRVH